MKEFALLFRQPGYEYGAVSPADMQALTQRWHDWIAGIAAQDRLVNSGQRLSTEGKVLKSGGVITDGPFVEIKERLGGFIVVRAASIDDAVTLAHGCPAMDVGGSVEIRPLFA